jgi:hypothetical protein
LEIHPFIFQILPISMMEEDAVDLSSCPKEIE